MIKVKIIEPLLIILTYIFCQSFFDHEFKHNFSGKNHCYCWQKFYLFDDSRAVWQNR